MAHEPSSMLTFVLAIITLIILSVTYKKSRRRSSHALALFWVLHEAVFYAVWLMDGFPMISPVIAGWSAGMRIHGLITVLLMSVNWSKHHG